MAYGRVTIRHGELGESEQMISDVLFETAEEIRSYQKRMPKVYEPWRAKLDALLEQMDAIRIELDTPPEWVRP